MLTLPERMRKETTMTHARRPFSIVAAGILIGWFALVLALYLVMAAAGGTTARYYISGGNDDAVARYYISGGNDDAVARYYISGGNDDAVARYYISDDQPEHA
jgi:hypothetical protein